MAHKQLTYEDRVIAYRLWKLGVPQASIAREIRVNRSTINREFSWLSLMDKNRDSLVLAREAHDKVTIRKSCGRSIARKTKEHLWLIVESKLRDERWSPENIALWLKDNLPSHYVSHRAIYDYINKSKPEMQQYLRRKGRRPRYGQQSRRKKCKLDKAAPPKTSIRERPDHINNREEIGHWEVDLVGSRSKSTLLILTERLSRFSILTKVHDKKSETIKAAILKILSTLPPEMRRSLTYDNGAENALHYQLNEELGLSSFFCEPYHSWEKGSVENRIGVVRIFFPKGTNFDLITQERVAEVNSLVNNRPLKVLRGRFPSDVFNDYLRSFQLKYVA